MASLVFRYRREEGSFVRSCFRGYLESRSGMETGVDSGMEAIVSGRGSSAAINSHCALMLKFLQELDILLLLLIPGELFVPCG